MLVFVSLSRYRGEPARRFLEWPVLRVLAPPTSSRSAATNHRFGLLMCYLVVALLFAWMAAALVPFTPFGSNIPLARVITRDRGLSVLVPAILLIEMTHRIRGPARALPQAARKKSAWMLLPAIVLFGLASACSSSIWSGSCVPVPRRRLEPDARATGRRRHRLAGAGDARSVRCSLHRHVCVDAAGHSGRQRLYLPRGAVPAFGLLSGRWAAIDAASHPASHRARLGDVLDMPAQNLPLSYVLGILLAVTVACFSLWSMSPRSRAGGLRGSSAPPPPRP